MQKIDLSPILSGDTDSVSFSYPLSITEEFADITFSAPATVTGEIKNMAGYMQLSLTAAVPYETVCARCLTPLSLQLDMTFERTVVRAGTLENTEDPESDDYIVFEESSIDLSEPLAEQIALELPVKHVCKEDCAGLCPKCGCDLNKTQCGCVTKEIDPRLAVLQQLLDSSDEE